MKRSILITAQLALLSLVCALAGCATTDTGHDGSLASAIILGHTTDEIRQTTIEVFEWNGYKRVSNLTFEKEGTKWDTMKYGSMGGIPVWIKICVRLATKAEGLNVLGCDAYVVEDHNAGFMETERRLDFAKRDECKKILDQIKRRLSLPPPNPS